MRYPASIVPAASCAMGGAYVGISVPCHRNVVFGPHQATAAELQVRIEAERSGVPFVFYFDHERRQRIVALGANTPRVAIGRAPDCAIRIEDDGQVSRVHAELERV